MPWLHFSGEEGCSALMVLVFPGSLQSLVIWQSYFFPTGSIEEVQKKSKSGISNGFYPCCPFPVDRTG